MKFNDVKSDMRKSINAFSGNQLAKSALYLVVWSSAIKFLVDNSYFQVIDSAFESPAKIASYMASMDLALNVVSFFLVQLVSPFIVRRFSVSQALTILPVTIVVLGGLALTFSPLAMTTLLMFSYYSLFRAIHRPLSRQCTAAIHPSARRRVTIFFNLVPCLFGLLLSGFMRSFADYIDPTMSLMLLIFGTTFLFLFISQLDSLYVRNLLSHTSTLRTDSGLLPYSDSLLQLGNVYPNEEAGPVSETKTKNSADTRTPDVLSETENSYRFSYDAQTLLNAARKHARAIFNQRSIEKDKLCAVLYRSSPRIASSSLVYLKEHCKYDFLQSDHFMKNIKPSEAYLSEAEMFKLNLVIQQRLKSFLDKVFQRRAFQDFKKINYIFKYDAYLIQDLVELFLDPELEPSLVYLFEGIRPDGQFTLLPMISNLSYCTYDETASLRKMIGALSKHCEGEISRHLRAAFSELNSRGFHISKSETYGANNYFLHLFMHAAFLNELILRPKAVSKIIRDSIEKLADAQYEEFDTLIEVHRRFLLKSEFRSQIAV